MAYRVRIEQFDREIQVEDEGTILSAALDAGLDYPFMCQQGQCGACKSYLVTGEVDLGTYYNPLVLPEGERARGLILACQARPLSDCTVSIGELAGQISHVIREFDCTVRAVERAAAETTLLKLAPSEGERFIFSAGQYATLTFPGLPSRDYSMANRPDQAELEFHIQTMPGGTVSRHVATHLSVGDMVRLRGPSGTAYFREEHLGPILLAAGATGLAPILSIAETALTAGLKQRLHLYFGVRTEGDLYRMDRLQALAARHRNLFLVPVLSAEPGETSQRRGNVSDIVAADFDDLSAFHAYVAGPPLHCEATRKTLIARGLPPEACFMDPFVTGGDR